MLDDLCLRAVGGATQVGSASQRYGVFCGSVWQGVGGLVVATISRLLNKTKIMQMAVFCPLLIPWCRWCVDRMQSLVRGKKTDGKQKSHLIDGLVET